jgi:hypothetical protein
LDVVQGGVTVQGIFRPFNAIFGGSNAALVRSGVFTRLNDSQVLITTTKLTANAVTVEVKADAIDGQVDSAPSVSIAGVARTLLEADKALIEAGTFNQTTNATLESAAQALVRFGSSVAVTTGGDATTYVITLSLGDVALANFNVTGGTRA